MTTADASAPFPRRQLLAWLEGLGSGWALSKDVDLWEALSTGGDWDVVVTDLDRAAHLLAKHVGVPARVLEQPDVLACFYPWGEIDLLDGLRYKGVAIVTAREALGGATGVDDRRVVRLAHQAIATCLLPTMAYGRTKAEYWDAWQGAARQDLDELRRVVARALGRGLARQTINARAADELRPRDLRRAFLLRTITRPSTWGQALRYSALALWATLRGNAAVVRVPDDELRQELASNGGARQVPVPAVDVTQGEASILRTSQGLLRSRRAGLTCLLDERAVWCLVPAADTREEALNMALDKYRRRAARRFRP
jgi:hypothetical protein